MRIFEWMDLGEMGWDTPCLRFSRGLSIVWRSLGFGDRRQGQKGGWMDGWMDGRCFTLDEGRCRQEARSMAYGGAFINRKARGEEEKAMILCLRWGEYDRENLRVGSLR